MTEKELRRLKRDELLQMIFYLIKKNEEISAELESLKAEKNTEYSRISDEDVLRIAAAVKEELRNDGGM